MASNTRLYVRPAIVPILVAVLLAAGCTGSGQHASPPIPEIRPGILAGYLKREALPVSLALLPPPPAPGSPAMALDQATAKESIAFQNTPRGTLAAQDAELGFPGVAGTFSCAVQAPIDEQTTPTLYRLLRRSLTDAGLATYTAKDHYRRTRPFVANSTPLCTPKDQAFLAKDGSYPSGHTAIGWSWALILSEIEPDRGDAILARGRAFGQSRLICNAHWDSDVIEGRFVAAGVVARLHSDPTFQADLGQAKSELTAARAKGLPPSRDCAAEDAALALSPPSAP
jgi:acid phosphatase (class A)